MYQSLQRTRRPVPGYRTADRPRTPARLGRDAADEQARMDRIRAEHLRAQARKAAAQ